MYTEMYTNSQDGRGTAIAVILVIAIIPFIVMNIRRFMQQEVMR
jgi:alpha-glucoside transport system permease protein